MYRGDQKVLERERDIEQVYYPNEARAPPNNLTSNLVGNQQQGRGNLAPQQYQGGPQSQQQAYPPSTYPVQSEAQVGAPGATLRRGDSFRSQRSECRSCSVCSSSRSGDYYKDRRRMKRSFPIAALLVGLLICVSFINFVGIWSPFWALARNPFLIYPVTSTTTVNTGVPGAGSGLLNGNTGGVGEVPLLLNPQTVQPPGGRIGIGNPIFGHLGIWAYCAPRSFCVTYPYGASRPYGFFSAAAFSLSLAGLGGFFTQLFGGPLLGNLIGGLGFGGGLGGALGPGFSGLGGFGSGTGIFKRSIPSSTDNFVKERLYYLHTRSKRADPPGSSSNINNNNGGEYRFGLNPAFAQPQPNRQQGISPARMPPFGSNHPNGQIPAPRLAPGAAQSRGPATLPPNFNPFAYYYDPKSPNGINSQYSDALSNAINDGMPNYPRGNSNDGRTFRQIQAPPPSVGSFAPPNQAPSGDADSVPSRNNRNLAMGNPLGGLGIGGIGALGLGSFGNRFGGMSGLLGSQQALVAFALLQPGPEGLPLPENFLFSLPGSISPFVYFRNRIRENRIWFLSVQILVGLGFAFNLLGLICGVIYLCAYHTKLGQILGRLVGVMLFIAALLELIGICVFITKMRLDRNAFFYIDPAFTIHSGVGWAFYVSLSGAILLLVVSLMLLWEANSGYHV